MKILLFNDNPVVRKLVALSAQKTKDDLSVVWSVEEIEESGYDLLIIDDALYSDETFGALKVAVQYKTTLLMATRGNAVPAGFDHIINKPFLPTDLVDLFAKIDKELASKTSEKVINLEQTTPSSAKDEAYTALNLEDDLKDDEADEDFILNEMDDQVQGLELADFDQELVSLDTEEEKFPAVLDHEEVQEVRGLLEDTEEEFVEDEKSETFGLDGFDFDELDIPEEQGSAGDGESFDFEGLDLDEEDAEADTASMNEAPFVLSDESVDEDDEMDLKSSITPFDEGDPLGEEEPLSDEALGALDLKIRQAIGNLEPDDLDKEVEEAEAFDFEGFDLEEETEEEGSDMVDTPLLLSDEESFDDADIEGETPLEDDLLLEDELSADDSELFLEDESAADNFAIISDDDAVGEMEADDFAAELEGFDELDMLDERELKLAIGEEIAAESEIRVGGSALSAEALDEAMELTHHLSAEPVKEAPTEGVEALQTLLKALANEDVVKSLKGLNISININFGNDK